MPFWQFYQKSADRLDWPALLVQPSISAHRKWPEMVVSASTNQVWTKITIRSYAWSFVIQIQIGMSTGYPGPGISRDIPGSKNIGISKPEKSRNKKSRDCECIKIPGFLYESWDIPAGFFPLFLWHFVWNAP